MGTVDVSVLINEDYRQNTYKHRIGPLEQETRRSCSLLEIDGLSSAFSEDVKTTQENESDATSWKIQNGERDRIYEEMSESLLIG